MANRPERLRLNNLAFGGVMNISEKRKTALYTAIFEPFMGMRVAVRNSFDVLGQKNADDIDEKLFRLQLSVWDDVKKALEIKD